MKKVKIKSEELKSKSKSKELCDKWFEKYLFGEQFGKSEKNTSIEQKVWNSLKRFIFGHSMNVKTSKEILNNLNKLKKCKKFYPLLEVKKPVYRGLVKKPSFLEKVNFKRERVIRHRAAPEKGMVVFKKIYKPSDIVQSWTTSLRVASAFSEGDIGVTSYPITNLEDVIKYRRGKIIQEIPVLLRVKKPDGTFFGSPELSNKAFGEEASQNEVFRIGKDIVCDVLVPKILERKIF